jgi:hypothetical protein
MMHIRYLVVAMFLILLPCQLIAAEERRAGGAGECLTNLGRALACLEDRFADPSEVGAHSDAASDWKIHAGISLFVAGNALTFSFPAWAVLGADVTLITGVIIAGEVIEVAGIFIMGDAAFEQLKAHLREWGM